MKKILFVISLSLVILVLAACGNPESKEARKLKDNPSEGFISISDNNPDLGTISMRKGDVVIDFTLINEGSEPVVLIEGETSCMCTEAVVKGRARNSEGREETVSSPTIFMAGKNGIRSTLIYQILEPGEAATLTVTFDPAAHGTTGVGPFMRGVLVQTNSRKTPELEFSFQGNVTR